MTQTDRLIEALHTSGRRLTRQRRLVMQVLQDNPGHLDVERVYALAKARDPNISLPTVYRTLAVLKEMGFVEGHTWERITLTLRPFLRHRTITLHV